MTNYLISRSGYNGLGDGPSINVMGTEGQKMLWTDGKIYVRRSGSWVLDAPAAGASTSSGGGGSRVDKFFGGVKDVLTSWFGAKAAAAQTQASGQQYVPPSTNYLPVIAIGGAAVLAVVLISRKK